MNENSKIICSIFRNQYLAIDSFPNYTNIYNELKDDNADTLSMERLSKIMMNSFRKTILDTRNEITRDRLDTDMFINCYVESEISHNIPFNKEEEKAKALNFIKYFNQPINRNAFKGLLMQNESAILNAIANETITADDIEEDRPKIALNFNNQRLEIRPSAIADYLKKDYYSLTEKISEEKFYTVLNSNVDLMIFRNNFPRERAKEIISKSGGTVLTNTSYIEYLESKRQEYFRELENQKRMKRNS